MKVTPTDQRADYARALAIIIITVWLVWVFQKYFFLVVGMFAFVGSAVWAWLSFLNPEDIIDRRDNFDEPEYGSAYDKFRQTGVDDRNRPEKPDSSDNPGQLCTPKAFTGVVTSEETQEHDWPEFKASKPVAK